MAHCRNEALDEKTRWVSSQVVGDSTAQTVTIRSIDSCSKSWLKPRIDNTKSYETVCLVSNPRETRG